MNKPGILNTGLIILLMCTFFVPLTSAVTLNTGQYGSVDYVIQDSAELISPLKMHIAYVGKTQQARMDGVITYIDRISSGSGTASLREIQEDYLTAAFPVPVICTAEEITEAREEMRRQSILFADETNTQLAVFNGSIADMRASAEAVMHPVEESFNNIKYSSWLASQTTWFTVFNQSAKRRTAILEDLSVNGLDVSYPRNLSADRCTTY